MVDSFKRRAYMVLLSLGEVGNVLALIVNEQAGTSTTFKRALFVLLTVAILAFVWFLYKRKVSVRFIEEAFYSVMSFVVVGTLAYTLYLTPGPATVETTTFNLLIWVPSVYVFIFVAYEGYEALVRSGVLYTLITVVSLPYLALMPPGGPALLESWSTFGSFYLSMAAIIAVLYFLTGIKADLRQAETEANTMKHLAETDPLTVALNRRGLSGLMSREIEKLVHHDVPIALIILDLDNFKDLNDEYGHVVGDGMLVKVTGLIQAQIRAGDSLARWGGEEFAILCPDTTLEAAGQLAERTRVTLEGGGFDGAENWMLSASFGVSDYREGESQNSFVERADSALYLAKEGGKNRVEVDG